MSTNIRLGCKCFTITNALAYYSELKTTMFYSTCPRLVHSSLGAMSESDSSLHPSVNNLARFLALSYDTLVKFTRVKMFIEDGPGGGVVSLKF